MFTNTYVTRLFLCFLLPANMFFSASCWADYKYDYYDYDEMVTLLQDLENESLNKPSNIFSLHIIGYSNQSNPIYAVKFSDNPDLDENQEPDVVIDSGIHSNEWLPVESNIIFIQYLFSSYYDTSDPDHDEVVRLVDNFEIWIIPMINPDGRIRDDLNGGDPGSFWTDTSYHDDTEGWRNNVQEVDCPARPDGINVGIDLNRNFSNRFWELSDCESNVYSGVSPFSAPEIKVLKQFINNHMVSLLLHQHSNIQLLFTASQETGLGSYLTVEVDDIFSDGLLDPKIALTNEIELRGGAAALLSKRQKEKLSVTPYGSGACDGHAWSGQFYQWLWSEIDCVLSPDIRSRRAIQCIFYEFPPDDSVYGTVADGNIGQYDQEDYSNGFHPSSGEFVEWVIGKSIDINKYVIKQSGYPFSPRFHTDMTRKPEAPTSDLALVGSKICESVDNIPGCFTYDENTGMDLLPSGQKRVCWNIQNNGTDTRTINTTLTVCNQTDDSDCMTPDRYLFTAADVTTDSIETFTADYTFEPEKNYSVTIITGETNSYDNDLKRYVFTTLSAPQTTTSTTTTTTAPENVCPVTATLPDTRSLSILRDFRDHILKKSPMAPVVSKYYAHAAELSTILSHDQKITRLFRELLVENMSCISAFTYTGKVSMGRSSFIKVFSLLRQLKQRATPRFRKDINDLLCSLEKEGFLKDMNVKMY